MPGPTSDSYQGPPDDGPYVPSWYYPNGAPKMCMCGHHEGYHNDKGECLQEDKCSCVGMSVRKACETCVGSGREMINFGHGDVRDVECSICGGNSAP